MLSVAMKQATKHAAVYLRVSSKSQDTKSQQPELETWAKGCGEKVVFYEDKASGATMDRPAWNKLSADVEAGKVSRVVVWRLDRLGRTCSGLSALFDDLQERKVGLVSLKDGVDLSTSAGRLMANVLASVAQFEREVRSERQRAGIEKARKDGKVWGGSAKGRRLKVTDEQLHTIQRLYGESAKVAAIARAVGLSRQTVYQYIPVGA
jgi:DNA invertase Pin-like site-specific DNA recombinase